MQATPSRGRASARPVKSISEMAQDEREVASVDGKATGDKAVKGAATSTREVKDSSVRNAKKVEPVKATKAASVTPAARGDQRKQRRDAKSPSWLTRLRQNRVGNFVYEAYYELRHKVVWPTFEEARNMTIIVVVLSAVIGAFLAAVDYGLYNLFLLISGGH